MPWARSDVGSEAGENGKALSQRCLDGTKEGGAGTLVEVVARSGKMWFKSSVFPKGFDCSPQVAMLCKQIHRQLALTMPNPQGYLLLYALLFLFFFSPFFWSVSSGTGSHYKAWAVLKLTLPLLWSPQVLGLQAGRCLRAWG